ncbi:MAG: histidinol-phosphate transaminase [Candidatus Altiarchaeota archaeon]
MDSNRVKTWINGLDVYKPGKTREGLVKLSSNENNYGPSPRVVESIIEWAPKVGKYPFMDNEVREAIARYAGVNQENVIAGNGSDELIDMIVKTFKGPFAGPYPSFSEYELVAKALGEDYVEVKLEEDFSFNAGRFIKEGGMADTLFLCTPNNPTGGVISREDIVKVLDTGKTVVVDEAYYEFGVESTVDLIDEYENLIILRTFAKAFGLAGLRVGYAIADEETIEALGKVKPPFNVNLLAQISVLAALEDLGYMEECVSRIKKDREALYNALSKRYRTFKSQSNFVLADVSPTTARGFYEKMLDQGFITRVFGKFRGFKGEYVRVTVGKTEENESFINALDKN